MKRTGTGKQGKRGTPPTLWKCDGSAEGDKGQGCIQDPKGQYTSPQDCEPNCWSNMWICNRDTGTCYQSKDGRQTFANCSSTCQKLKK